MATRAQLRTWLRRRLQETSAAQWTDSSLNEYLNEGLREVADAIKEVDAEFVVYQDSHDIVSGQALYKFPTNMDSIIELHRRPNASSAYVKLEFRRRKSIRDNDTAGTTTVTYSTNGRYFQIAPEPSANITKGLYLHYVPVMSLGDDTDVPPLPTNLHRGIVFAAQLLAYGDTAEATDKTKVQEELDRFLIRAQQFYETNRDEDEFLTPYDNLKINSYDP